MSDSNRRPTVYKTVALPTELNWPKRDGNTIQAVGGWQGIIMENAEEIWFRFQLHDWENREVFGGWEVFGRLWFVFRGVGNKTIGDVKKQQGAAESGDQDATCG